VRYVPWIKLGVGVLMLGALALGTARLARGYNRPARPALEQSAVSGIRFESVADAAGLRFEWKLKKRPLRNIDAFGAGCAFFDYDNDGAQDILLVGEPTCGLFRNHGTGKFTDVSRETGLDAGRAQWTGCAPADYDGDGWLDVLLTGYHRLALLRNRGGRGFVDATRAAGLDPANWNDWGASAGFMDLDADGDLDLVVLNYVISGQGVREYCEIQPGVRTGCPPATYEAEYGRLFRNSGRGTFADASASAGVLTAGGKALVVGFCDADGDGKVDFYVGNDGTPADFYRNVGGLRFKNIARENGTAFGENPGHALAAMGVDWADYNRDGKLDFAVSAFSDESYAVFRNEGSSLFVHASQETGIAGVTLKPLGFGTKFTEFDNDGWPDLVFANGHVYDRVDELDPASTFRQPLMLFQNREGRRFVDLIPRMPADIARPLLGRGLATGDYDNDGKMDLLVVDFEGTPVLLHNVSETSNHWISLDLRMDTGNRFAYGAQVTLRSGAETWVGQVSPAGSYLSSSDPRVHFGLGNHASLDSITIRWPSGEKETLVRPAVDRLLRVVRGKGASDQPGAAGPQGS